MSGNHALIHRFLRCFIHGHVSWRPEARGNLAFCSTSRNKRTHDTIALRSRGRWAEKVKAFLNVSLAMFESVAPGCLATTPFSNVCSAHRVVFVCARNVLRLPVLCLNSRCVFLGGGGGDCCCCRPEVWRGPIFIYFTRMLMFLDVPVKRKKKKAHSQQTLRNAFRILYQLKSRLSPWRAIANEKRSMPKFGVTRNQIKNWAKKETKHARRHIVPSTRRTRAEVECRFSTFLLLLSFLIFGDSSKT